MMTFNSRKRLNWLVLFMGLMAFGWARGVAANPTASPAKPMTTPSPTPAPPQPTTLTLQQALERAVECSPEMLLALSKVRGADIAVRQAYVPMQPTLTINANYIRTLYTTNQLPFFPVSPDAWSNAITLQQTILNFGKTHWQALAARLARKQAAQDYRTAVETLLQQIETQYIVVQVNTLQIEILEEQLQARKDFVKTAENLVKAGEVAYFDVLQYRSNMSQAEQSLLAAKYQRDQARLALLIALNLPPQMPITVEPLNQDPPVPPALDDGIKAAMRRRPELAALRWAIASAEAQEHYLARTNAPTLSAQVGFANATTNSPSGNQWTGGLVLTFPILDGGSAHLQREAQKEVLEQTRQSLESSRRSALLNVTTAAEQMSSLWKQLSSARDAVDDSRQAFRIAQVRYKEGMTSGVELLNNQQYYVSARQTLAKALADYGTAWVNWRRAISAEYPVRLPENLKVDWELPPETDTPGQVPGSDLPPQTPNKSGGPTP